MSKRGREDAEDVESSFKKHHGIDAHSDKFRPGDWVCSACDHHNFATRDICRECRAPKPYDSNAGREPQVRDNECYAFQRGECTRGSSCRFSHGGDDKKDSRYPEDWTCFRCREVNFARRVECRACREPRPAPLPDGWKPGDWRCSECREHNFASRMECRACHARKPMVGHERQFPPMYGRHEREHMPPPRAAGRWSVTNFDEPDPRYGMALPPMAPYFSMPNYGRIPYYNYPDGPGGPGGMYAGLGAAAASLRGGVGGGATDFKEGDWRCRVCDEHNFASRVECRRCRTPQPQLSPASGPGGHGNECYAFLRGDCRYGSSCKFTHPARSAPAALALPRGGGGGNECYAFQRGECDRGSNCRFVHDGAVSGDWTCEECGDFNFARRSECRKCGVARRK